MKPKDGLKMVQVLSGELQVPINTLGPMTFRCQYCDALKFEKETGMSCCLNGKVFLPRFSKPPEPILRLYFDDTQHGQVFRKYSRSFNNGLCLSSIKVNERRFQHFTPSVIFEGRVHQYVGSLEARDGEQPRYAQLYRYGQLYMHDPALETTARIANMHMPASISGQETMFIREIVEILQTELRQHNPFVQDFRQIMDIPDNELQDGQLVISAKARPQGEHARRYNPQTNLNEVSVLTSLHPHDLVINRRGGDLQIVSNLNPKAMPLHFTVLFPLGDKGWDPEQRTENNKRVTTRQFTTWHMAIRDSDVTLNQALNMPEVDYIHRGGRLFQEWVIWMWMTTEDQKLNYQSLNQKALRADTYRNVRDIINARQLEITSRGDALHADDHQMRIGTKILSRSMVGSPRWYHKQFLDAMAICREYHKPDYFITMTCNPHWPEIKDHLLPNQTAQDRPDVVARVFKQKKDAIMNDLVQGSLFGHSVANMSVVEFQKRGLPHVHILLIVSDGDRLTTTDQVDNCISAEIPPDPQLAESQEEKEQRQRLQDIVITNMVHGPCGAANPRSPCMEDGKCTKKYPKEFKRYTVLDPASGFPTYRRRAPEDGGRTLLITRGGRSFTITNRDVVAYNPYLSLRYNCHINVEKSTSPRNAKYLYKYVTKGPDRACVSAEVDGPRDEIADYKDLRSCGSCEAVWHLNAFPIACRYPSVQVQLCHRQMMANNITNSVQVLRVHQKDEQHVVFEEGAEEVVLERQTNTELVGFFNLNDTNEFKDNPELWLTYLELPRHYTWNGKIWKKRVRDSDTIGRIDSVHPAAGDTFYLRMLLNSNHSKGKTGFDQLRTLPTHSTACQTYKQVCEGLGMLQDDTEWENNLKEADQNMPCSSIRSLYIIIIMWCDPSNPRTLFDNHWEEWTHDIISNHRDLSEDQLKTLVLLDLKQKLLRFEKTLVDYCLPEPTEEEEAAVAHVTGGRSVMIREELEFDIANVAARANEADQAYTDEQRAIHKTVLEAVKKGTPRFIFINARGGCGKTFLLNGILQSVRSSEPGGCVALATATTGKAAMHLDKGRTFHSRFKAPLALDDKPTLRIPVQSELAKLIRVAKIILIDEATMLDNRLLAALEESLRDIMNTTNPFGDKIIVLSGDFCQTLPVVKGASRAGIVSKCINQHPLWCYFEQMKLTVNVRVNARGDQNLILWDEWLKSIGDGEEGETVTLPTDLCFPIETSTKTEPDREKESMSRFMDMIFPDLATNLSDPKWLDGRCILTPTNINVDKINHAMVLKSPHQEENQFSADSVDNEQDARSFSVEYVNSLNPTGLPNHRITVKKGVPLMLLRNLDPSNGLCNGTRLIFQEMRYRMMMCTLIEDGKARTVAIPRINLRPLEKQYPFDWSRRQYPVRVAFASTINKAQGDTLKRIGIWLSEPVFGHGQLYVALSRVGNPEKCTIAIRPKAGQQDYQTRNVVYQEVIRDADNQFESEPNVLPEVMSYEVAAEFMHDWQLHDGVDNDSEDEVTTDNVGPQQRQTVQHSRPVSRSRSPSKRVQPPPTTVPTIVNPLTRETMCPYELIREDNIEEREAAYLRIFGEPFNVNQDMVNLLNNISISDSDNDN